jgi:uncharacterized membrane protein YfcA
MESNNDGFKGYVKYSLFAIQMGVTIYLGAYLGKYLDSSYPSEKKWFTMIFIIVAVALSLYNLIRQLNKDNSKEK